MLTQSSAQALARLRAYSPPPTQWYNCPLTRRAAVLILLFPDRHGELKVVLTMRASTLRSYAGQAALPGGKSDSLDETPFDTARREAYEEIGLPTNDTKLPPGFQIEHLCEIPANLAKTELGVRPCVAFLSSPESDSSSTSTAGESKGESGGGSGVEEKMIPRLDPKEVAAVFTAPFKNFLRKNWESHGPGPVNKAGHPHSWYRGSWTDWHESRWRMHNFYIPKPPPPSPSTSTSSTTTSASTAMKTRPDSQDPTTTPFEDLTTFRVFGMTARILVDAARVAYGEEPEFEHNSHFGDEDMLARLLKMGRLSERREKGEELTKEVLRKASRM
ncbi:NUDIX domain-containing protein [Aaosphaeria arxii CBS 175.79]|uniref:NUDIX domain-containing protein n=1 Tax=Aaosphaeria arxii CBS 175.79 TaxID=1450172 RepID=A0A6A5XJN0_9PLEO|nr:NUDIX domain-containing protein [Aaosphaeria arxii CBS 175.79]KAF2013153.1 NUDIX domain-containing protein [Aaosphaeria arxii CBS 175.79]